MVDPLVTGLIGFIAGLASSPLLFVGYSALFQTAQSIDNTVDNDEET